MTPPSDRNPDAVDTSLLLQARGGDREAVRALVRRHQSPLYNFALRFLGNPAAAETVVLDAFLRLLAQDDEAGSGATFAACLYGIGHGLCAKRPRPTAPEARPSSTGGAEIRVLAAVAALPDDAREVFLLREVCGLPFAQIALAIGVPDDAVKKRMRSALEGLKGGLADFPENASKLR